MFLNKYYHKIDFNSEVSGFLNYIKLKSPMENHPLIFLNYEYNYLTNAETGKKFENGLLKFRNMLLKKKKLNPLIIFEQDVNVFFSFKFFE